MRHFLTILIVISLAVPVVAGPPTIGVYYPDTGRFSESWKGGQEGAKDNTINAMSWNGSSLGAQWTLQCMVAAAQAEEIERDIDGNGTGYIKYRTVYHGGPLWLSATGPWGDGSESYTCIVNASGMVVTVTHQYVMGTRIGAVSDITVGGIFELYDNCFTYVLTNAAIQGFGPSAPVDYPPYQDETCATGTSVYGAWGSVTDITLSIYAPNDPECRIPVKGATWGNVKSMYGE